MPGIDVKVKCKRLSPKYIKFWVISMKNDKLFSQDKT